MESYSPMEVAIALSLYSYNVSAAERARKLYEVFDGHCADEIDLARTMAQNPGSIVTELAYPSALAYVNHALERYGAEAKERCRVEESFDHGGTLAMAKGA